MPSQHPRQRVIALFTAVVAAALLSACSVSDAETTGLVAATTDAASDTTATAAPPKLSVTDGATDVEPGVGVKVTSKSEMQTVTLTDAQGNDVDGEFNSDETEWENTEDLNYGTQYTLTARVAGGKKTEATFTTAYAGAQTNVGIGPLADSTVGVAQAITFSFGYPIQDTKAAEQAITVETSNDTEGGFFWLSPQELRWRPKEFWEPGTEVTVKADLFGRNLGGNVWGATDMEHSFTIGEHIEAVVDNKDKKMRVYNDGELVREFPVSLGRDNQFDTPNGTYVVGDAHESLVMDSRSYGLGINEGGYVTPVDHATQLSYSGIYVHSAPWALDALGKRNQSHGCVNATPEDARWFQHYMHRGDPVIIKNTGGQTLTPYDGLGYWNLDWETRSGGSKEPMYE